ncbi:hypothetical protein [Streptomyces sp. HUAS TT7]|uniref:hypothetical protein n=1 Tax=Streptomyces sp. HUAS TT7 TaxID=3447507 RepID=UPI003F65ABA7
MTGAVGDLAKCNTFDELDRERSLDPWPAQSQTDLQLRVLLDTVGNEPVGAPMPDLDEVLAQMARELEGIRDVDVRLVPVRGGRA